MKRFFMLLAVVMIVGLMFASADAATVMVPGGCDCGQACPAACHEACQDSGECRCHWRLWHPVRTVWHFVGHHRCCR